MTDGTPQPEQRTDDGARSRPVDRWWLTSALYAVVGLAVALYQVDPILDGTADWLNWAVGAGGLVLLVVGFRSWLRSRPR